MNIERANSFSKKKKMKKSKEIYPISVYLNTYAYHILIFILYMIHKVYLSEDIYFIYLYLFVSLPSLSIYLSMYLVFVLGEYLTETNDRIIVFIYHSTDLFKPPPPYFVRL